jgi:hypothetical protein
MKKPLKTVVLGSATLMAAGITAQPVLAAQDSVKINARIISPVAITQTGVLNFGSISDTGAGGGTLAISTAGTPTESGVNSIGSVSAGGFRLKGASGATVVVTAPATAQITHTSVGMHKMTVNNFKLGPNGSASPYSRVMAAATDANLKIGATLNVTNGQATGKYTGAVTLTAVYQ